MPVRACEAGESVGVDEGETVDRSPWNFSPSAFVRAIGSLFPAHAVRQARSLLSPSEVSGISNQRGTGRSYSGHGPDQACSESKRPGEWSAEWRKRKLKWNRRWKRKWRRANQCQGVRETAAVNEISGSNIAGLMPARLLVSVIIHALPVQV